MRPRWGKANEGAAEHEQAAPADGEQPELIEIIFELPPSTQGTYQYEREDGATAHGDASGKWTLDKNGEVEDIVLFMSPGWHRKKRRGEGA